MFCRHFLSDVMSMMPVMKMMLLWSYSLISGEAGYFISIPILSLVLSSPRICWISQMSGDWLLPMTAILMTVLTCPT